MIQTATRTTAGANKNKNATMAMHSENGIGDWRYLIHHRARGQAGAKRAIGSMKMQQDNSLS
jgi:hypothetical protein